MHNTVYLEIMDEYEKQAREEDPDQMAEDELYYYEQLQAAGYGQNGIPAQYAAEMEAM